jgi:hypothetical protein
MSHGSCVNRKRGLGNKQQKISAENQGEKVMPQYLVCNYMPDDFDPSTVTEAMMEEIHALNRELIAAGVRKFACGISPVGSTKTLRGQPDGTVLVTDGPYAETKGAHGRILDTGSRQYG